MSNPVRNTDSLGYLLHLIRSEGVVRVIDNDELYNEKDTSNAVPDEFLILDGELEHHVVNGVYSTPFGLIPRVRDVMKLDNVSDQTVLNRVSSTSPKYADWSRLVNPTQEQIDMAIENVNELYLIHFSKTDHCDVCNALDNALFREGCWLVSTTHLCGEHAGESFDDVDFLYSYGGIDYTVSLGDWLKGHSPHILEIEE